MTDHGTDLSSREGLRLPEGPAVKAALKASIERVLAEEAATPGGAATPEHLAGPGRIRAG
jgi:hypothetical protein